MLGFERLHLALHGGRVRTPRRAVERLARAPHLLLQLLEVALLPLVRRLPLRQLSLQRHLLLLPLRRRRRCRNILVHRGFLRLRHLEEVRVLPAGHALQLDGQRVVLALQVQKLLQVLRVVRRVLVLQNLSERAGGREERRGAARSGAVRWATGAPLYGAVRARTSWDLCSCLCTSRSSPSSSVCDRIFLVISRTTGRAASSGWMRCS
jgi:hypothetical protein